MKDICVWCDRDVEVLDHFNRFLDTAVCSKTCACLEFLFRATYSDSEYNRRWHYREMTRGNNE